jgi:glycosidase/maltose-binding protein MalE
MKGCGFFSKSPNLILNSTLMAVLVISLAGRVEATRLSPPSATIIIWHTEADTTVLNQIVTDFQALYPSITVQLLFKDTSVLSDQFIQAAKAGGGPDLVRGPNDRIGPFATNGLIRPVDVDFDLGVFITQAVLGTLWSGQHWAVPDTYGNHLMLFYNKSLLASAPSNTTNMISLAKSLTGGGRYGLVYHLDEPFWLMPWLTGFGGWVLDESANPVMPALNTPAMVDALQFVHDLRWVHGIVPPGNVDYSTADNLFRNGNAAMMINGDWTLNAYLDHFGAANLGVARIPLVSDTAQWPLPMVSGMYYMINSNSSGDALAASRLFIAYAASKPAQLLWPQKIGKLPARLDALSDPVVQANPVLQASADQAGIGRLMPTSSEMNCVWNAMFTPISQVLDDTVAPSLAALAMQADAAACVAGLYQQDNRLHLPLVLNQALPGQPWWDSAVFYEIFLRSFYDSNHDGIGDINGLIQKLDYLNDGNPNTTTDLGVTGIWLMPIHPSPTTHGYDAMDYYAANPQYGTLDDYRRLLQEVHRRGMRLINDLPLNHTSSQHPWFIQSQDAQSSFRNWYVWSAFDPGWKGPWGQQVWYPLNGAYYYAFFWEGMPDLNYTNPAVTAEMQNVTHFWLKDVGIDGFRLDAVGTLIEEGSITTETQSTHDWFANFFKFYKGIKPDAMTIGEVWNPDSIVVPWVANRQVDLAFEFDLSSAMLASINGGNSTALLDTLRSGTSQFPAGQYGTFLTNHDMSRVMTQLGGNPQKAKAAASLYFSLPGVPFVYYGEETGMFGEAPDDGGRLPMQWSGGQYAGFSDVAPWRLPGAYYETYNVASETGDPASLLSHYRTLISLRNAHPALRTGRLFLPFGSDPGVFAGLRTAAEGSVLVLVNLTNAPIQEYQLSLASSDLFPGDYAPIALLDDTPLAKLTVSSGGQISNYIPLMEIPAYATIMMQLSK